MRFKTVIFLLTLFGTVLLSQRAHADYMYAEFSENVQDLSTYTLHGDSGDRSASTSFRLVTDSNGRASTIQIFGQASADRSTCMVFWCPPDASATLDLYYRIPLALYRPVEFVSQVDGSYTIVVPRPRLDLSLDVSGTLQLDGSFQDAGWNGVRVVSTDFIGGFDGLSQYAGDTSNRWYRFDSPVPFGDFWFSPLDDSSSARLDYIAQGESIGEVSDTLPFDDFKIWGDDFPPFINYGDFVYGGFIQRYVGYLDLRTTLEARSAHGDEAIACLGLESPLNSFVSDLGCDTGHIQLTATLAPSTLPPYTFTVMGVHPVPEPGTLALLGLGLAGLGLSRRRDANWRQLA